MWQALQHLASGVRDVVAPARCIGCLIEGTWHCTQCLTNQLRPPILNCIVCNKENRRGRTCSDCKGERNIAGSISVVSYKAVWARRAVHWLKFKGIQDVAQPLALLLSQHLQTIAPLDVLTQKAVLTPIPLHAQRLRERGFNQSEVLAQKLSNMTGIPMHHALTRTRSTQAQSHLPHNLRTENTQSAFKLTTPIPDTIQFCIFIDDVVTTGATLASAASVIPPHIETWACTVARG